MKQISFRDLMRQAMTEYKVKKTLFGVPVVNEDIFGETAPLFGGSLGSIVGPAAGPHTQLAQNLICGYGAGGRFFELKTVQVLWGEQLGIQRPCIHVRDEAYNTEWSTELRPDQAAEEYIKAWIAIWILAGEYGIGNPEEFQFNMSVGYDLPGIQSPTVDAFIEAMKDASRTEIWKQCMEEAKEMNFAVVDADYLSQIPSCISNSVTLSTMHGCPPDQIEAIAAYMLKEKHLHTYVKVNPTLVGAETARKLLDELGYTDIIFENEQFEHDMKLVDAIPMFERLLTVGEEEGLRFGIKVTNTFPVKNEMKIMPGDTMYMSGKPLFPLSIHTAALVSDAMEGRLPISYSGGADRENIARIYEAGIYPITVATDLLKPGGYRNLKPLVERCAPVRPDLSRVDAAMLQTLASESQKDTHLQRKERKVIAGKTPPFACGNCRTCVDVCPNRANYFVDGLSKKVIHLDGPCNDCGNCASVCPFGFVPYADKFICYPDEQTFRESSRDGYVKTEKGCIVRYDGTVTEDMNGLPEEVTELITAVTAMELAQ